MSYAAAGWPVIPLKPREKTPLTAHGLNDASDDPETVERWWGRWPDANVGLRTGIIFDVLDIDGPDGVASLTAHVPGYTHDGPVSRTGRGYHLLFAVTGAGNGQKMLPGIDFRGRQGYIVAPPSIHPLGHRYTWTKDRPAFTKLPEPTEWLLDLIMPQPKPATPLRRRTTRVIDVAIAQLDLEQELHALDTTFKRIGNRRLGACPFHNDDTPSLNIYPNETFFCFGCGAWGDALNVRNYAIDGRLR